MDFIDKAFMYARRRLSLLKLKQVCPKCKTDQIYLLNYLNTIAQWKCRECRNKWYYEPIKDIRKIK